MLIIPPGASAHVQGRRSVQSGPAKCELAVTELKLDTSRFNAAREPPSVERPGHLSDGDYLVTVLSGFLGSVRVCGLRTSAFLVRFTRFIRTDESLGLNLTGKHFVGQRLLSLFSVALICLCDKWHVRGGKGASERTISATRAGFA